MYSILGVMIKTCIVHLSAKHFRAGSLCCGSAYHVEILAFQRSMALKINLFFTFQNGASFFGLKTRLPKVKDVIVNSEAYHLVILLKKRVKKKTEKFLLRFFIEGLHIDTKGFENKFHAQACWLLLLTHYVDSHKAACDYFH
ncbi:hypothetical protein Naga_100018g21 [Nannochloropsis gaditana]|uniref:Uncharacterized protein n=1 Tax=Nannochloropsis gaditana TaxID=72520 RepID=W7U1R9_9STRA|nr:hypothetical protein Naga_100018g21 [Nannochloropsis gaditana]